MKNKLFKKGRVVGIILLFIGMSVVSSAGNMIDKSKESVSFDGNTFYVGGSGPNNYTTIQSAIDAASDGDTVFVYGGTYVENVKVNKTINLIGEDKELTVIDSYGGIVLELSANGAAIAGFTIRNGGYTKGLFVNSDNNIITGNNIVDNGWIGIFVTGSSHTISENTIDNNYHYGMWLDYSSDSNSIYDNTISDNKKGIGVTGSNNNIIYGNIIENNREEGIYMSSGSSNNIITENTVKNNGPSSGIYMIGGSNNVISSNDISDNKRGFYLHSTSNNIFSKNTITNNGIEGMHLWCSSGNNITENNIASHLSDGIILRSSSENTVTGNAIANNDDYGIVLVFNLSFDNKIYHNDFINNHQNALDESDIENYFDDGYPSGGNYWDDYTGEDNDGDEIGDTPYPIPGGEYEDRYPLMESCCDFPYAPTVTGPTNGKPGVEYNYTFVATDPNNDDLYYRVDWGDGIDTDWFGPYHSGEEIVVSHTWSERGEYALKARAKDTDDLFSPWGILTVTMPRNRAINSPLLQILEQLPNAFPIIRQPLGL